MATMRVKYKCGDRVIINHNPPTEGIVTAIVIRGMAYEVGYTGKSGPTSCQCQEEELAELEDVKPIGFRKHDSNP